MSEKTETTWTCSRCGDVKVLPIDKQPKGWIRVHFGAPPRSGASHVAGDLCRQCEKRLYDFVNGTDAQAVEKDRQMLESLERVMASLDEADEPTEQRPDA